MSRFAPADGPLRRFMERPATTGFLALCWAAYAATALAGGMRPLGGGIGGLLAPSHDALQAAGMLDANLVLAHGEWERTAASFVLHGGLLHILFNASALAQLGGLLETLVGSRRAALVILASGFAGSAATLVWSKLTGDAHPVVGASGAGCGVGAALWTHWLGARDGVLAEHRRSLFAWLVVCLLIGLLPGVSLLGHLGGALGGAAVGLILRKRGGVRLRADGITRALDAAAAIAAAAFVAGILLAAVRAPDRYRTLRSVETLRLSLNAVEGWVERAPTADELRAESETLAGIRPSTALAPVRETLDGVVAELAAAPGFALDAEARERARARLATAAERLAREAVGTGRYRLEPR